MSLEGLRAWIGEVERKLGKRTRVFLALTVIAIGIAGAAVYLAIDARESSVSESDVQALQEKLETRIDEVSGWRHGAARRAWKPNRKPRPGGKRSPSHDGKKQGGGSGDGTSGDATGGAAGSAKLQELLQRAKERADANK